MISSKLTFTDRGIVNERIWHRSDGEDLGGNEKQFFFIISLNFNYQYLHIFSVAKKYYSRRDGNSEVPALVNKYESVEEVDIFEEEDEDDDWDWDD